MLSRPSQEKCKKVLDKSTIVCYNTSTVETVRNYSKHAGMVEQADTTDFFRK